MLSPLRSRLAKATPLLGTCRQLRLASSARYPQAVSPLAFDLHSPANPSKDEKTNPILFFHGLFGSKKNNRAISK